MNDFADAVVVQINVKLVLTLSEQKCDREFLKAIALPGKQRIKEQQGAKE